MKIPLKFSLIKNSVIFALYFSVIGPMIFDLTAVFGESLMRPQSHPFSMGGIIFAYVALLIVGFLPLLGIMFPLSILITLIISKKVISSIFIDIGFSLCFSLVAFELSPDGDTYFNTNLLELISAVFLTIVSYRYLGRHLYKNTIFKQY